MPKYNGDLAFQVYESLGIDLNDEIYSDPIELVKKINEYTEKLNITDQVVTLVNCYMLVNLAAQLSISCKTELLSAELLPNEQLIADKYINIMNDVLKLITKINRTI